MTVQNYQAKNMLKIGKTALLMLLFITIFALAIARSSALVSREITIVDRLQEDQSMSESVAILISNNTDKVFGITLPDIARNIVANGQNMTQNNINISLNCTNCDIKLSYEMDNVVNWETNGYVFYRTLHFPNNPESLRYVIYLPSGYTVNSTNATPMIVPNPTDILTDGSHIMIEWAEKNPQLPKQYYIKFQGPESVEAAKGLLAEDIGNPIFILICLAIIIIGGVLGYYIRHRTIKMIKEKPAKIVKQIIQHVIPSSLLSPDEKTILSLLKKKDAKNNPVNQKEIGKELNWSKSKVSAVLSNLYYKKIIDREKFGRNYKVKLIKDVGEEQ